MKNDVRAIRLKVGMHQTEFWENIGLTQSGGSRYESGQRRVPAAVWKLISLVYDNSSDVSDALQSFKEQAQIKDLQEVATETTMKDDIRAIRLRHNMSQVDFWGKIGISQSNGSKIEAGQGASKRIKLLVMIVYGDKEEGQKLLKKLRDQCIGSKIISSPN